MARLPAVTCLVFLALGASAALASEPGTEPRPAPADAGAAWDANRLARLVAALSDERFAARDGASRELEGAPPGVLAHLVAQARRSEDAESRKRLLDAGRTIFQARLMKQLAEWKVGRGFLGIQWTISSDPPGVLVAQVLKETAADRAGLKDGDIIVKIDRQAFEDGFTHEDALKVWKGMAAGDPMSLEIQREGEAARVEVKATVGEMPAEYRSPDFDEQKAEVLWEQYLEGKLKIPERLLRGEGGANGEANGKQASGPLQSWPKELEASK